MSPMLEYVYQMTGIDAAYILIGMACPDSDSAHSGNCSVM